MFSKPNAFRSITAWLTAGSMLLTSVSPLAAQGADSPPPAASQQDAEPQTPPTGRTAFSPAVTIDECQNIEDPQVRGQLRALTEATLQREIGSLNYAQLVDKYWLQVQMDDRLNLEIDEAIRTVRDTTNILDRAYSTVSPEQAEKVAIAVAERAFASPGFKTALTNLVQGVGNEFGKKIEQSTGKIAEPIIACVRSALQNRYGGAIAQVFVNETEKDLDIGAQIANTRIGAGDLAVEGAGAISGIILIVSRRIVARIVTNIGRRIAGLIASRIVATFAGLIGLALIVRDLYEANEGVFPLIDERMKSNEAKQLIKAEITKSIETELNEQIGSIADETAERIYSFWLDFKTKYNTLLRLAEKSTIFADFLKNRKLEQLGRLGRLIDFLLREEGEDKVFARAGDGSLSRALFELNDAGVTIAIDTKSLETALAWQSLAGNQLQKVVELGLPGTMSPDQISKEQLTALLSLNQPGAAVRLARLDPAAREALFRLPADKLQTLARRLSQPELSALAVYQSRLEKPAADHILRVVAEDPAQIRNLVSPSVQNSILRSRDQLAAVSMLLRDNLALSFANISNDFSLVRQGEVHYRVFVERYWVAIAFAILLAAFVLLALRRLIIPRPVIVRERKEKKS